MSAVTLPYADQAPAELSRPAARRSHPKIKRTASQAAQIAKIIQEALLEASRELHNAYDAKVNATVTLDVRPPEPAVSQ
ncbi:hypothetical protein WJX72_009607 [[Myrmecia] bisecta]|uniref:Uncharacterized protein n=1 Tax=[Myrmecia] bisecta TaxID=41462 RepID=A0AAW1QS75_9CHLO